MRSSTLLSAAFAGCALGSPMVRRDEVVEMVTDVDVVYVTQYVTEIAGASPVAEVTSTAEVTTSTAKVTTTVLPSTSTDAVESTSVPVQNARYHEGSYTWSWVWSSSAEVATSAEVVSSAVAFTSTAIPVVESTSAAYVKPSSTSVYVAPSSTAAAYTSSAAETTTAASAKATTYQERVIVHHNVHRTNHSAPALTWSDDLANTAQQIAESCVYAHNVTANGGGFGQNIAAGVESSNISSVITDLFYNGEVNYFNNLYGQANPDMSNFESWGHFSQIVWKATTQVGCATVDCSSQGLANVGQYVSPYFTVCNYKSPGNYGGEYADNIGDSLNRASVGWNYGL